MKKLIAFTLVIVLALGVFGTACKSQTPAETPAAPEAPAIQEELAGTDIAVGDTDAAVATEASDETLRIALSAEPAGLLPCIKVGTFISAVGTMMYDQLVWYNNETAEVEPQLAESWEMVDEHTWRFKLREDVVSQNGQPFTANDVLYTFQIGCASGLSFYTNNFEIDACKVIDEYTVEIVLKNFNADLLRLLCTGPFHMAVQSAVEAIGTPEEAMAAPVDCGTGKYKFVSWASGDKIVLERNDNYWGAPGYYKTIEFTFISDDATRLMALQSGDIDATQSIAISQVETVASADNMSLWATGNLACNLLLFNCSGTPFEDVRVRQAVAYAIDREAIWNVIMYGYGAMTDTNLSTANAAYRASANPYYAYDVEKAKTLLAEAGYADGFTVNVMHSTSATFSGIAEILQNYLSAVGITCEFSIKDSTAFFDASKAGEFDMQICACNAYTLNRATNMLYGTGGYTTTGWASWQNADFDAIVDSMGTISDMTERGDLLAPAYELVREQVPVIGLFNDVSFAATNGKVGGLALNINGEYTFKNVSAIVAE